MATKVAIPEIWLNTWDFSPVRLGTQGVTCPQVCFRQAISIPKEYRLLASLVLGIQKNTYILILECALIPKLNVAMATRIHTCPIAIMVSGV
jgi:hypothetical protein